MHVQPQPFKRQLATDFNRRLVGDFKKTLFRDLCNRSVISVFIVANQFQTGCRVGVSTPEPIDSLPASASEIDIKSNELKCLIPILNAVPLRITWKNAWFFFFFFFFFFRSTFRSTVTLVNFVLSSSMNPML